MSNPRDERPLAFGRNAPGTGVPDPGEEGIDAADAKERLDADPEEQENRVDPVHGDREPGRHRAD